MSASNLSGRPSVGNPTGPQTSSSTGVSNLQQATTPPRKEERREGPVATAIEKQTSKIPSDWFLWAAGGSIALSLALQASGKKERANFVGQWAPTFLILGLYNKIVKVAGSDQASTERESGARYRA